MYGVEANERVAHIARINVYLHDSSHIFHCDGLDIDPLETKDMASERRRNIIV